MTPSSLAEIGPARHLEENGSVTAEHTRCCIPVNLGPGEISDPTSKPFEMIISLFNQSKRDAHPWLRRQRPRAAQRSSGVPPGAHPPGARRSAARACSSSHRQAAVTRCVRPVGRSKHHAEDHAIPSSARARARSLWSESAACPGPPAPPTRSGRAHLSNAKPPPGALGTPTRVATRCTCGGSLQPAFVCNHAPGGRRKALR
jgi:hypothetical protein